MSPGADDEAVLIKMDRKKVIFFFFSRKNKQGLSDLGVQNERSPRTEFRIGHVGGQAEISAGGNVGGSSVKRKEEKQEHHWLEETQEPASISFSYPETGKC